MFQDYNQPYFSLAAFLDKRRVLVTIGFSAIVFLLEWCQIKLPLFGLAHKDAIPITLAFLIIGGYSARNAFSSGTIAAFAVLGLQPISGSIVQHAGALIVLYFLVALIAGALATPKYAMHQLVTLVGLVFADYVLIAVLAAMSQDGAKKLVPYDYGEPVRIGGFVNLTTLLAGVGAVLVPLLLYLLLVKPDVDLDYSRASKEKILGIIWMIIGLFVGLLGAIIPMSDRFTPGLARVVLGSEQVLFLQQMFGSGNLAIFYPPLTPFLLFLLTGLLTAFGGVLYIRGRANGTTEEVSGGITAAIFPAFTPIAILALLYSAPLRQLAGSQVFYMYTAGWIVMFTEYALNLYVSAFIAFIVILVIGFFFEKGE